MIKWTRGCIRMGDWSNINKPIIHEFFGINKNDPNDYKCIHCGYSLLDFAKEKNGDVDD